MPGELEAVALGIASILDKQRAHDEKFIDITLSFDALLSGQGRIIEHLAMVNRQLVALNKAVAQEPDGENLGELLRTILTELGATTAELRLALQRMAEMPAEVANVLHADGLVADPPQRC